MFTSFLLSEGLFHVTRDGLTIFFISFRLQVYVRVYSCKRVYICEKNYGIYVTRMPFNEESLKVSKILHFF